ncbi:MAG: substrate-binding domain-containing protein [Spirochaetia bacterium]|nr:substrate-binding domain-containing protein [Spirochaetia bacterium]
MQDSIVTGETQMESVIDLLGGKGKIAIMMGEPGTLVAQERIQGNMNILEKYTQVELVAEEVGNWQRDEGMAIMENWLSAGIDIDAIVASNDEMALGAVLALENEGVRDDYIVSGIDATPIALEFMKEGRLDHTMFADAKTLSEKALESAMKLIKDGQAEDVIIKDVPVYPENVDEFLALYE